MEIPNQQLRHLEDADQLGDEVLKIGLYQIRQQRGVLPRPYHSPLSALHLFHFVASDDHYMASGVPGGSTYLVD